MSDAASKYDPSLELWRLPKVIEKTGMSRTEIYRQMDAGTFPLSRRVGASAIAWRSTEVIEWMHALPVASADGE